jgi:aminopeptidase N
MNRAAFRCTVASVAATAAILPLSMVQPSVALTTTTSTAPNGRSAATHPRHEAAAGGTSTTVFRPGSKGVGDSYFPHLGNGGYDVKHYSLHLAYTPRTHHLGGYNRITARATQNLSRFDLDLSGYRVQRVTVNRVPAAFARQGQELMIRPRHGLRSGQRFIVTVWYAGTPRTIVGSPIVFGAPYGWIYTTDGAFVGCEPNAAHTWFPSNDHPSDKATFTIAVSVPSTRKVVANGDLSSRRRVGNATTFVWNERQPMATYLATVDIGRWQFHRTTTRSGVPEFVAVDPRLARRAHRLHVVALTGKITDFWSHTFGRYPFGSTGAIVDDVPDVGFSLETQTRPLYGFAPDQGTMSHELAHEWYGDSVSVRRWRHIWLNEGFATFASWLWLRHIGGPGVWTTTRQAYNSYPANDDFWKQSIADPQRNAMFSGAVYVRGAMTLGALRHKIGAADMRQLLRAWARQHRHANATTHQFTALAEKISGTELTHFFRMWLWWKSRPSLPAAKGAGTLPAASLRYLPPQARR